MIGRPRIIMENQYIYPVIFYLKNRKMRKTQLQTDEFQVYRGSRGKNAEKLFWVNLKTVFKQAT